MGSAHIVSSLTSPLLHQRESFAVNKLQISTTPNLSSDQFAISIDNLVGICTGATHSALLATHRAIPTSLRSTSAYSSHPPPAISVPIQPKTTESLPRIWQNLATTLPLQRWLSSQALEPENKDAMALLADCEAHSGDFQAAVELLTEASRLVRPPNNETVKSGPF